MYKIAICEDDKEQQKLIKNLISTNDYSEINEINVFDSGEDLVHAYEREQRFSIILLDIQMNGINGIQTAERIRKLDKDVLIIIITSILEYAVDGYSINAYNFILKPIDTEKFCKVMNNAIEILKENENKVYRIQTRESTRLIKLSDIQYIESDKKKIRIHCKNEVITNNESISEAEKKLTNVGFLRISRFYLLNMKYIKEMKVDDILLQNGRLLKYSKKLQNQIKNSYMNYMIEEI